MKNLFKFLAAVLILFSCSLFGQTSACGYTTCVPQIKMQSSDNLQMYGALVKIANSIGSGSGTVVISNGSVVVTNTVPVTVINTVVVNAATVAAHQVTVANSPSVTVLNPSVTVLNPVTTVTTSGTTSVVNTVTVAPHTVSVTNTVTSSITGTVPISGSVTVLNPASSATTNVTVETSVVSTNGSTTANAFQVSFLTSDDFTGTINGASVGGGVSITLPAINYRTYPSISYTRVTGSILINLER